MRVCGVEIKNSEAIICMLSSSDGLFDIPDCRVRSIELTKSTSQSAIVDFQRAFKKLIEDYSVEKVVILERFTKGKLAGSSQSFKVEAAIQLIDTFNVQLLNMVDLKRALKNHALAIPFTETGLKSFQEGAFKSAYAYLASSQNQ